MKDYFFKELPLKFKKLTKEQYILSYGKQSFEINIYRNCGLEILEWINWMRLILKDYPEKIKEIEKELLPYVLAGNDK